MPTGWPRPSPLPWSDAAVDGRGGTLAEGRPTLDRVGPGSVLGGRYVLGRRIDEGVGSATWKAHDDTLERPVFLHAVDSDHPQAAAVLDAARRAAAIEDPRLVRILDVGHDEEVTFVVSEWLPSESLADRLRTGPLLAEDARTLVGEAALALEAARHRGLHHLRLTPERIRCLDDGTVKIIELATAAALDGDEPSESTLSSDEATRRDTRDLVAIAYAALTGAWPLDTATQLPPAPEVGGQPVAPGQIAPGVPADLDTLCSQAFAGAGAPDSPGQFAAQIAPWGRDRHAARPGGAFPHALRPQVRTPTPTPTGVLPALPPVPPTVHGAGDDVADDVDRDQPTDLEPARRQGSPRTQARMVIALVGGFVAVFLLLAYCGLRGVGDDAFVPPQRSSQPPRGATSTPPATGPTSTTPPPSPPAARPLAVTSARGFDPQGDGTEKNSRAARAIDGKSSTSWTSDTYRSQKFGGLKDGVGLALDLGATQTVTQVRVTVGGQGSTVQLRTATGDTLEPAVLASASNAAGTVTLRPAKPVQARTLVLWFTVPAAVSGGFRVEVAEVAVS